jgi:hypothetical protein
MLIPERIIVPSRSAVTTTQSPPAR